MDDMDEEKNSKPDVASPSPKPQNLPAEEEKKEGQKDDSLAASLSRFLDTFQKLLANFMNNIKNLISSLVDMMRGPKGEDSKTQEQDFDKDEMDVDGDEEQEEDKEQEEDEASKGFLSELWAKISEAFSQVMKFISGIIKSLTEMVFGKGAGNEEEEGFEMELVDTAESKPEAPAASGEEGVSKSSNGVISEVLSAIWKVLSDFIRSIKELVFGKGSEKNAEQGIEMSSLGKTARQPGIKNDHRAGPGFGSSGAGQQEEDPGGKPTI